MSTPHIQAEKGEIAKKVLMPGDPLRAKFIAETYLQDVKCFNQVRNMLGYTGKYEGKEVSVMGSGMGMPSIGIYSYELFNFYDVDSIIRVGSAGAIRDDVKLKDICIAQAVCTDSNFQENYNLKGHFSPIGDIDLLLRAIDISSPIKDKVHIGNILSSDIFYHDDENVYKKWAKMGVLAVEMETAALYMNATTSNKKALGIFTVSDHILSGEALSSEERQIGFGEMIEIALKI